MNIMALVGALVLIATAPVYAAESSSFKLYDEHPNYADRNPATSNSYTLNEAGETWIGLPITGSNFQIVTAPPSSSSSSSSSSVSSSSSEDAADTDNGGHRGNRTNEHGGQTHDSAPQEPDTPVVPVVPTQPIIPPRGQVVEPMPEPELEITIPIYNIVQGERQLCDHHLFNITDQNESCVSSAPEIRTVYIPVIKGVDRPVAWTLLMVIAFIAGYGVHGLRRKIITQKTPSRKKS